MAWVDLGLDILELFVESAGPFLETLRAYRDDSRAYDIDRKRRWLRTPRGRRWQRAYNAKQQVGYRQRPEVKQRRAELERARRARKKAMATP